MAINIVKLTKNNVGTVLSSIRDLAKTGKDYRISIEEWSGKRTPSANSQQHVWYKRVSEFTGDDIKTAGNACKLDFGLPILLSDPVMGAKIGFVLDKIGFVKFNREQQINVMGLIQITSLFSTKQHNQYRDQMQIYWFEQGLNIDYL